jgi:hypothetical protein
MGTGFVGIDRRENSLIIEANERKAAEAQAKLSRSEIVWGDIYSRPTEQACMVDVARPIDPRVGAFYDEMLCDEMY